MVDFTFIKCKFSKKTTKLTLKWGVVCSASAAERKSCRAEVCIVSNKDRHWHHFKEARGPEAILFRIQENRKFTE